MDFFSFLVSLLCIQPARFLGVHDVCDTGVHAQGLLRREWKHTHIDIKLTYSSLSSYFLPPHLLS